MSKKFLVTEAGEGGVPFLRGILVRSLVQSGLPFADAYAVADQVRDRFQSEDTVSSAVLRAATAALLKAKLGAAARDRYQAPALVYGSPIMVNVDSLSLPFSEDRLAHSLQTCAIDAEAAHRGAKAVHETLRQRGRNTIHSSSLRHVVARCLDQHVSAEAALRYLCWRKLKRSGTPLLLLIGGITGVGKSSLATELAYRLGIVRTQSTDMMREIIRSMLPEQLNHTLSFSSFEAWRGLPSVDGSALTAGDGRVLDGFLNQFLAVRVALDATLRRSVAERQHLILEGVHVLPSRLRLGKLRKGALVIPMTLAATSQKKLRHRLEARIKREPGRSGARYLESFDSICELQSFLLAEADRSNIDILVGRDIDATALDALELISQKVMARFPVDLDKALHQAGKDAQAA